MTWKFRDTVQADFSGLGSLGERKQKLIEHFLTRTSSERPLCVRSVTVFADLEQLVFEAPYETRTISISITGYVQTKQSRDVYDDKLDKICKLGTNHQRSIQQMRVS
jgi:hypothetical protein